MKNQWMIDTGVANRLKNIRRYKKYTLLDVNELTGISESALRNYERGTTIPSMKAMDKLADLYDVSIDWLCGRTEKPTVD